MGGDTEGGLTRGWHVFKFSMHAATGHCRTKLPETVGGCGNRLSEETARTMTIPTARRRAHYRPGSAPSSSRGRRGLPSGVAAADDPTTDAKYEGLLACKGAAYQHVDMSRRRCFHSSKKHQSKDTAVARLGLLYGLQTRHWEKRARRTWIELGRATYLRWKGRIRRAYAATADHITSMI